MANAITHDPCTRWQTTLRPCAIADQSNAILLGQMHDHTQFLNNGHHDPPLIEYKSTILLEMLGLQLIPLLITVSAGLKVVPFGEIKSAETLFSSPSLSTSPAPISTLTNRLVLPQ
jgi:hypothetical protein